MNVIKEHQVRDRSEDFSNMVTDYRVPHIIGEFLGDLSNFNVLK